MEQVENKKRRPRRTAEEIKRLMEEFENGDKKISKFCTRHHISNSTFHQWENRFSKNLENTSTPSGFAKLNISSAAIHTPQKLFAKVHGIKIYQIVEASFLKQLAGL